MPVFIEADGPDSFELQELGNKRDQPQRTHSNGREYSRLSASQLSPPLTAWGEKRFTANDVEFFSTENARRRSVTHPFLARAWERYERQSSSPELDKVIMGMMFLFIMVALALCLSLPHG